MVLFQGHPGHSDTFDIILVLLCYGQIKDGYSINNVPDPSPSTRCQEHLSEPYTDSSLYEGKNVSLTVWCLNWQKIHDLLTHWGAEADMPVHPIKAQDSVH